MAEAAHLRNGTARAARAKEKDERKADHRQDRKRANVITALRRRHDQLEREIDVVERELAEVSESISESSEAGDMDKVQEFSEQYRKRNTHLKELWDEWEHVGEKLS